MDDQDAKTRGRLALWVAFGGIAAVAALSVTSILRDNGTAKDVLTMTLPVIGTWVGTVLAFYFAKDNLLAATQSTKDLLGLNERLQKIPVEQAMLRIADTAVLKRRLAAAEDPGALDLAVLSALMRDAGRNRLPVLKADGSAQFIIHLSTLTDFVAQQAAANPTGVATLTIADLQAHAGPLYEAILKFVFVKRGATLVETKAALESMAGCADVFVTETGKETEPVIGWVTNVQIGLMSQA